MNAFSRPYIYCGECLRRVSHESGGRCSKCGKKSVIGLFEKIRRDDSFSGKQKTELRFCALITAAALVFEIAFCIVAVVISGDIIQRAERDIDITLSVESERLSEIDINETLGTPPPYSDFCFYMDQDNKQGMDEMWRSSGLTMEQISYWRSVYSQQYIFQSEERLTSDDIRDTAENNHYIRYFGILRVVMIILAVFSGICIIPCVFLALKQEWALTAVLGSCKLVIAIATLHTNLITAGVAFYSIINITRLIQKAEHGCTYDRLGNIDGQNKEKPLILDSNQWRCSSCGYINEHPAAECRSCGKYK